MVELKLENSQDCKNKAKQRVKKRGLTFKFVHETLADDHWNKATEYFLWFDDFMIVGSFRNHDEGNVD